MEVLIYYFINLGMCTQTVKKTTLKQMEPLPDVTGSLATDLVSANNFWKFYNN